MILIALKSSYIAYELYKMYYYKMDIDKVMLLVIFLS